MSDGVRSPEDPLVGQVLSGRFLTTRVVQRTADTVAYEGIDQKTRRPVRIQRPATSELSPERVKVVKACGPAMSRVAAVRGVLGPIEGGIHAGLPFLVLPPLPGGTLSDRLRLGRSATQGGASARAIRSWLESVASTLDSVHAIGTAHGRLSSAAIVVGADGSASVDGFPLSQLQRAIGLPSGGVAADDPASACRAPEIAAGAQATAKSDQYALAAIVAEAFGRRPAAVAKALAPRPDDRFPSCSAFAAALLAELESPSAVVAGGAASTTDAPLELADTGPAEAASSASRPANSADQVFELELDATESDSQLRGARRTGSASEEEDLSDITFTKPGQSLLTPKSSYSKASDLRSARTSWRRMIADFKGLPARKQLIARIVIGAVAALVALWLLQVAWRAVDSLVRSGQAVARSAVEKLQPDVGKLRESGQQFAERMRALWDEHVPADEDTPDVAVVVPSVGPEAQQQAAGDAWPSRLQDKLDVERIQEPKDLIDDLVRYKGAFTPDGLGVFHVDDPRFPDQPPWIGGFGLLRKPGLQSKPLLHGTLMHHAEDGTTFVIRYLRGTIRDFWCLQGPADARFVMYSSLGIKNNEPLADGGAFVLDAGNAACLALVFADGEPMGGQWCVKKQVEGKQEKGKPPQPSKTVYEPPTTIVSLDKLADDEGRVTEYMSRLEKALGAIPDIQTEAVGELRKFVRLKKLK